MKRLICLLFHRFSNRLNVGTDRWPQWKGAGYICTKCGEQWYYC